MVERSLRASPEGKKAAKTALIGSRLTQQQLADALGVTRQPVNRFFNCKPVTCELFVRICEQLKLDWQAIAQKDDELEVEQNRNEDSDIDALVQEIREKVKSNIRERCGTMRVLDMAQPIELTGERGIYTNVNILEKITGRRRLEIAELLQNCDADDFERFGLNKVTEKRVPGLEAVQRHSKLIVLGKPGAGKTTFLKYLAMQCIEGQFQAKQVPLFITLKDFAEAPKQPDVLEYIAQQLSLCGVRDASTKAKQLLKQGRALVLLDGLDEVREEDTTRVLREIREVSGWYHTNQFVITCRIAAKEYTFDWFSEVEMADFDEEQIAIFAHNWFRLSDPVKAERFIHKLKENKPIQELATNPLLLTLLCLVFGEMWLMKRNIDSILAEDKNLQCFLERVQEKTISVDSPFKPTAIRAWYLGLSAQIMEVINEFTIVRGNELFRLLPGLFTSIIKGINAIDDDTSQMHLDSMLIALITLPFDVHSLHRYLSNILQEKLDCKFQQSIHEVWDKLPDLSQDEKVLEDWMLYDRTIWTEQLRAVIIEHRNIGHEWQFSDAQKQRLQQYYEANKLLVDCLNSDCYVSREVRQEIEDTLLLPMSEIEKRQQGRVG